MASTAARPPISSTGPANTNSMPPAASDATCDGVDNDCNGETDEDYVPTATTCGVGTCAAAGTLVCEDGSTRDTCVPGTPASDDASCDGLDNDCNGEADEDYVAPTTTCGVGACEVTVPMCMEGEAVACEPGAPGEEGMLQLGTCMNGVDDDCDGAVDALDVDCVP